MRHYVCALLAAAVAATALFIACTVIVDAANAKETTSLDDAINRPVVVQKHVDKENNVVCYWVTRYPKYLSCIQIRGLRQHNTDVK